MHQLPRPRVVPLAMGEDSCKFHPAVAPPAYPGYANSTKVRRLQRKDTQNSYRHMKAKLLSLVSPLPALAIQAVDLEAFRESTYTAKAEEATAEPEPHVLLIDSGKNMCSWCGIWQPLPILLIDTTGELGNQPTVAMSAAVAEPRRHYSDPDKSYIDLDILRWTTFAMIRTPSSLLIF